MRFAPDARRLFQRWPRDSSTAAWLREARTWRSRSICARSSRRVQPERGHGGRLFRREPVHSHHDAPPASISRWNWYAEFWISF